MKKVYRAHCHGKQFHHYDSATPRGTWWKLRREFNRDRQNLLNMGWQVKLVKYLEEPPIWLEPAEVDSLSITDKRKFDWLYWMILVLTILAVMGLILKGK